MLQWWWHGHKAFRRRRLWLRLPEKKAIVPDSKAVWSSGYMQAGIPRRGIPWNAYHMNPELSRHLHLLKPPKTSKHTCASGKVWVSLQQNPGIWVSLQRSGSDLLKRYRMIGISRWYSATPKKLRVTSSWTHNFWQTPSLALDLLRLPRIDS